LINPVFGGAFAGLEFVQGGFRAIDEDLVVDDRGVGGAHLGPMQLALSEHRDAERAIDKIQSAPKEGGEHRPHPVGVAKRPAASADCSRTAVSDRLCTNNGNFVAESSSSKSEWIVREVGVALRGGGVRVSQQSSNDLETQSG
jgi:hypothetical protein